MTSSDDPVERWLLALRNGVRSGTAASLASAGLLALRGHLERGDPFGPLNGPSQWLWGKQASYKRGFTVRHTAAGYAIHHASSILWATLFERMLRRANARRPTEVLGIAAATSLVACIVDYRAVPERFTPGFERRLSRRSLALTYVVFGAALAGAALLGRR